MSYFFVKKIPLSQCVEHVYGRVDHGSVDHGSAMYVCHTNQIGSTIKHQSNFLNYKGKWYVRRFHPDTVENGHIYSSVKEEEVFIYWVYLDIFCRYVRLTILWAGLIVFSNWIISQRIINIVFGILLRARDEGRAFPII